MAQQAAEEEKKPKAVPLTEDEKRNILSSAEFQGFFDRAAKIVQRAMHEDVSFCRFAFFFENLASIFTDERKKVV